MIAAATVAKTALIHDRPVEGLNWVVPALVPIIAAGQFWMLGQMVLRRQDGHSVVRQTRFSIRMHGTARFSLSKPRTFFFGDLYPVLAYLLLACFIAGWLAAVWGNFGAGPGNAVAGRVGCPYPLKDQGSITCVTRGIYQHLAAGQQRFGASILFSVFSVHLGAALGSLPFLRARTPIPG
jgi:hypothetical protein